MDPRYKTTGNFGKAFAKHNLLSRNTKQRRETRTGVLMGIRNITTNMSPCTPAPSRQPEQKPPELLSRLEKLAKWQEEKKKRAEQEKLKSKPVFKVYHVKQDLGPPGLSSFHSNNTKVKSFAPANHQFKPPKNLKKVEIVPEPVPGPSRVVTRSQTAAANKNKNVNVKNPNVETKITRPINMPAKTEVGKKKPNRKVENANEKPKTTRKKESGQEKVNNGKSEVQLLNVDKPTKVSEVEEQEIPEVERTEIPEIEGEKIPEVRIEEPPELDKPNNVPGVEKSKLLEVENQKFPDVEKQEFDAELEAPKPEKVVKTPRKKRQSRKSSIIPENKSDGDANEEISSLDRKIAQVIGEDLTKNRSRRKRISRAKDSAFTTDKLNVEEVENEPTGRTPRRSARKGGNNKKTEELEMTKENLKITKIVEGPGDEKSLTEDLMFLSITEVQKNPKTPLKELNKKTLRKSSSSGSTDYEITCKEDSYLTPNKVETPPVVYVSPFVTLSRGKDSARKEYNERKLKNGISPIEPDSTSSIAGAAYFSRQLNQATSQIRELCNKWETYKTNEIVPEEATAIIDTAIGQSNLLLTKKCLQFVDLIDTCKNGSGEPVVTCEDLHGYWDVLNMQITNVNKRFEYVEQLKENKWEEVLPVPKKQAPKKNVAKKKPVAASSSIRDAIKAARLKKKAEAVVDVVETKTPRKSHGSRKSLVDSVNKSNKRRISSPGLMMMKVGQIAKTLDGTPAKSILKTESSSTARKTVGFKEVQQIEPHSDSANKRYSLRSSLARAKLF